MTHRNTHHDARVPSAALAVLCLVPQALRVSAAEAEPRSGALERRFELTLPASLPEVLTIAIPLETGSLALELERHSLRAPGAFVRVVGEAGETRDHEPPLPTTYRGSVRGDSGSTVCASLLPAGLSATIQLGSGERLRLEPGSGARRGLHVLRPAPPPEPFECGSEELLAGMTSAGRMLPGSTSDPFCLKRATIAFEADYPFYLAKGSVNATVAAIDALMNEVDPVYARDLQLTHAITAYVVRTQPYYAPTNGPNLLDLFAAEWQTNQADVPRDMAHLVIGEYRPELYYGGFAFIGSVCDPVYHYAWSTDSSFIVAHELGHNWGAVHCHDVTPCNVMCDGCLFFGPNTRAVILSIVATMTCLEPVGPYPVPVTPYVHPEQVVLRKDELRARAPLAFDVLADTADGNCQPLFLGGFEPTSAGGVPVRRSPSPGPRASGRLEYDALDPVVGRDSFSYQVSDGDSPSYGSVSIETLPLELHAYYPLDEGGGTGTADATGHGQDATLLGAGWNGGRFGSAVDFDGRNDSVVLPPLGLHSNQVTITTWIRRDGEQLPWTGLVYTRAGNSVAGLHFDPGSGLGRAKRLRYTWNADAATFQWGAPELVVPNRSWCFAALVIRPESATIYLHDGTELKSATNAVRHAPEEFDGETYLGQDPYPGRRFRGQMDDVRIYRYALSEAEIAALAAGAGPADAPFPRDGGRLAGEREALSWLPAPGASDHALYFGTSWSAVRDATPSSPEFRGYFDPSQFVPGATAPRQTYYWRVDEAPFTSKGHVWQFRRRSLLRWALDEKKGSIAYESGAKRDGTYYGTPLLGEPGATSALGRAVRFDGDDYIHVARLAERDDPLFTDRLTLTLWLRREGPQGASLFSASANGLGIALILLDDELLYGWVSPYVGAGLALRDGEWTFLALVFEPTRDRLYLGRGGLLTSSSTRPTLARPALGFDACWIGSGFRGLLDDVRLYDEALSPAEIEALYADSR